jgi:hypothetical protein
MGKLGILLSPIIETTPEFVALYDGPRFLDAKRVVAFEISPRDPFHPSDASYRWWQRTFHVTFKSLAMPPDPGIKKLLPMQPLTAGPSGQLPEQGCHEVVDEINGMLGIPPDFEARGALLVRGWLAEIAGPPYADAVVLLTDAAGNRLVGRPYRTRRSDVATYFKDERLVHSGYVGSFDISQLDGVYTLQVGIDRDNLITVCAPRVYKVTIHATQ